MAVVRVAQGVGLKEKVWNAHKTSDFQQHFKLIFELVFNDVFTFIALQRKAWKKYGNMFPPHDTLGVAVVRAAVVLGGSCPKWQLSKVAVVRGRASGGASGARPPIWNRCPHFTFGPPVAAYIQYCIFKMCSPLRFLAPTSGFCPPLLLHPGDGPGLGRIQSVSLGGAISVIFGREASVGSQVSFRIVQNHGEKSYFRRF